MTLRRPYLTPGAFAVTAFPTLKRGANKLCEYGAAGSWLLPSIRGFRSAGTVSRLLLPAGQALVARDKG